VGRVTTLAGVCLQDVERGAHRGCMRLLASRLRQVSSKATHPPNYLPLHIPMREEASLGIWVLEAKGGWILGHLDLGG